MTFEASAYGSDVARILALDGAGQRLMPLSGGRCSSEEARRSLAEKSALILFPNSAAPKAAWSGLWLYFSCLDESHSASQDIETSDGSFWHGIMHRQEPDASNAGYWFRRVGNHPVFPALLAEAQQLLRYHPQSRFRLTARWDPFAFIEFCEMARNHPDSDDEQLAREIQRAEWQILFDHCAKARA